MNIETQIEVFKSLGYKFPKDVTKDVILRDVHEMTFKDEPERHIELNPFSILYYLYGGNGAGRGEYYTDQCTIFDNHSQYRRIMKRMGVITHGEINFTNIKVEEDAEGWIWISFHVNGVSKKWKLERAGYIDVHFIGRFSSLTQEFKTKGKYTYYCYYNQQCVIDYATDEEQILFNATTGLNREWVEVGKDYLSANSDRIPPNELVSNIHISIQEFDTALVALQDASGQTYGKTKLRPLIDAIDNGRVAVVERGGSLIHLDSRDDLQSLISSRDRHLKLSNIFPENRKPLKLTDELNQGRDLDETSVEKSGFSKYLIAIVGIFLVLAPLSRVMRNSDQASTSMGQAQPSQPISIRNVEGLTTSHKLARIVVGDPTRIDQEKFKELKQLDDTRLKNYLNFYVLLMLPEDDTAFEPLLAFSPDGVQEIRNAEQFEVYEKKYFQRSRQ